MTDAATQDQTTDATTPLDVLVGGPPKGSMAALTSGMADIQRKKTLADEAAIARSQRMENADRAQIQKAFDAEGHGPEELKPWDASKEHEKFEANPLEAFGSVGGLFAMVASAFTKAPMENAINGMAGAINGIKQGKEESYQRAYDSWKENMKLAEQRQKMQHEAYQDSLALADHDVTASNAKLRENAVRFGDKQVQFLLEHGMNKELYELIDARNKAMEQAVDAHNKIDEYGLQRSLIKLQFDQAPKTGDPRIDAAHKLNAFQRVTGQLKTPQQELMGQFFADHPDATAEEAADYADKHGIIRLYGGAGGGAAGARYAEQKDDAQSIAEAIAQGKQPPVTTGLYGLGPKVRANLQRMGVDESKLQLEWKAAEKQVQSLNGPQLTRFAGLAQSVDNTIDETIKLAGEMDNIGMTPINSLELRKLINLEGNSPKGQLATKYVAAVNTLKEEFANLANGGYAPTEPAWKLANEQINANYGADELAASLEEVQRLIRYRINAIPGLKTIGPGSPNQYMGNAEQGVAPAIPEEAARKLKEGVVTTFKNGQKWTVRDGKPVQVDEGGDE